MILCQQNFKKLKYYWYKVEPNRIAKRLATKAINSAVYT